MADIQIINGPNLNLLGKRETAIYGSKNFLEYFEDLKKEFSTINLHYFQSNHEGALLDKIHEIGFDFDGIILNAGAYTHTSIALADAIKAIHCPVVEVHISNVHAREKFRHHSYIAPYVKGSIIGFGLKSYNLAVKALLTMD